MLPLKQEANKYYFVVANAKFMLDEEEHFKELLFERLHNFGEAYVHSLAVLVSHLGECFPNACFGNSEFMKLRLDRVLSDIYEANTLEEALASNPTTLEFEKPENWVAPYPKYEYGWWEPFLLAGSKESKV
ncbi:hypothetical protein GH714_013116 [Hevea brasiliensis]|uniref:Uncharacterized protein n=1 Tax=Hevea brasiliensis TaxID=3981 RepID=A0A6A6L656_HEVBR|nr:hypothetical protein GH714_013116 [Hevea brasiliensis]